MNTSKSFQLISVLLTFLIVNLDARPSKLGRLLQPAAAKAEEKTTPASSGMKSIRLFPKLRNWCRGEKIDHIIEHEGCTQKTIQNQFCIGQCYSYTSPDVMPSTSELRLNYCDSCQKTKTDWQKIELKCGDNKTVEKLVEIVLECKCKDCRRSYYG